MNSGKYLKSTISPLILFQALRVLVLFTIISPIIVACGPLPRAQEPEARNHLEALIRAERTHWFEYEEFTDKIDELIVGVNPNYYEIDLVSTDHTAIATAKPIKDKYRGKSLVKGIAYNKKTYDFDIVSCKTKKLAKDINLPKLDQNGWTCGEGSLGKTSKIQ